MKIAFFTEGKSYDEIPRDHDNIRTDLAWMIALNAPTLNLHAADWDPTTISQKYDLGICIIPKKDPAFDLTTIKSVCNKVAVMQEGPHWYFQDYSLDQQVWYYNTLREVDFLLVHNIQDAKYYTGLTNKQCIVLPSLIIEDNIQYIKPVEKSGVIIGGNFCSWYGGFPIITSNFILSTTPLLIYSWIVIILIFCS